MKNLTSTRRLAVGLGLAAAAAAWLIARQFAFANPPAYPAIGRAPSSLSSIPGEGSNPPNQTFQVWNSGSGTLNYTLSKNQSWLSLSSAGGDSTGTGDVDTITVSYDTDSLAAGFYGATIIISDTAASNNPQTIAVSLEVRGPQYDPGPTGMLWVH